jgi:hypothetical protein
MDEKLLQRIELRKIPVNKVEYLQYICCLEGAPENCEILEVTQQLV